MIQNLVALGNCPKTGSNRGTGTEWGCALRGCASSGSTGIGAGIPTDADGSLRLLPTTRWACLAIPLPSLEPFVSMPLVEETCI